MGQSGLIRNTHIILGTRARDVYNIPKSLKRALSTFHHSYFRNVPPLPGLTPNGRRVVMMNGVDLEQISATVADGMKVVLMIGDIRLKEEHVGVAGDVYILDASVATPQNFANHFAKFTPSLIKKFLICVQVYTLYYALYLCCAKLER